MGLSGKRLGKNPLAAGPLRFPGEKPGSIVPLHEPLIDRNALRRLNKFESSEPWVPAFAGKARVRFQLAPDICPAALLYPSYASSAVNHVIGYEYYHAPILWRHEGAPERDANQPRRWWTQRLGST
jgi:hypothetical protein